MTDASNPFASPAPQDVQPQPVAEDDNPFARPASAAFAQPQVTPQPQAPAAPQSQAPAPARGPQASTIAPTNNSVDVTPDEGARATQLQADVAQIINSQLPPEAVRAAISDRLARDGLRIDQVTGLDDALAYRAKYDATIPVGLKTPEQAPVAKDFHGPDRGRADAFLTGALDSVGLGWTDEIGAGINAGLNSAGNLVGLGSGESFGDNYARTLADNRQRLSDAEHYHGGAYLGGQFAGGLATLPLGGEAALAQGGLRATGRLATEGAALGGVYGAGSAQGGQSDRVRGALSGAALGGIGGAVIGTPLNALSRRITSGVNYGREVLNTADRLNALAPDGAPLIHPLPANVSNRGPVGLVSTVLEPSLLGGTLSGLGAGTRHLEESIGARVARTADDLAGGGTDSLENIAEMQRAGAHGAPGSMAATRDDGRTAAQTIYRAAEQAAGDARVPTPRAVAQLDGLIGTFRETPGDEAAAIVNRLTRLRDQLRNGPDGGTTSAGWTIDGLRRLRTTFGDDLAPGTYRTLREIGGDLWSGLSEDIFRGLRVAGRPDAARLYRDADQAWAHRVDAMATLETIIGTREAPAGAGQIAATIRSMSRRNAEQLDRALRAISPEQAGLVRGAIIHDLGRTTDSRAVRGDDPFSLETFLTNWGDKNFPEPSKRALFPNETIRDLNDLAFLAGSRRGNAQRFGNPSGSGRYAENMRQLRNVVGSAGGKAVEGGAISGAFFTGTILPMLSFPAMGFLLARPGVARALVRLSEDRWTGGRLPRWFMRRTAEIARRYPAAEQNILQMNHALESGKAPEHGVTVDSRPDGREKLPDTGSINLDDNRIPLPESGTITLD